MRLKDVTELLCNNDDCVVLKVKDGCEKDLICLGYFRGDETMFRLTKGHDVTCTIFHKNGRPTSWCWGRCGHTLVSDSFHKAGKMIQNCIEHDYGILCEFTYRF